MADPELIEMGYPCAELSAVCDLEGKMIKACPSPAERMHRACKWAILGL